MLTMISKENQEVVLSTMAQLIEAKGNRKKMVSVIDITESLRKTDIPTSKVLVESIIDVLIQHKLVNYWVNEHNYRYYGLLKPAWDLLDKAHNTELTATVEEDTRNTPEKQLKWAQVLARMEGRRQAHNNK